MSTACPVGLADLAEALLHLKPDAAGLAAIAHTLGMHPVAARTPRREIKPPFRLTDETKTLPILDGAAMQPSSAGRLNVEVVRRASRKDVVPEAVRGAKALPVSSEMLHPTPAPLLDPQQLRAFLQDRAGQRVPSEMIDLEAAVEQIARLRLDTFPRTRHNGFRRGVSAVFDTGAGMDPFSEDIEQLRDAVQRFLGPHLIGVCEVSRSPFECDVSRFTRPGATTLLVTDLGMGRLRGTDRSWPEDWLAFSKRLTRAGQRVVAIVPYGPERWPRRSGIRIVYWGASAAMKANGSVEDLARSLAIAGRIDAALVRAARRNLFPASDAGLEADFLFSHLLAVSTPRAVVFHREELHRLRTEIARRPSELENAKRFLAEYRKVVGPRSVQLEEEIVYLALRKSRGAKKEIEKRIAKILRTFLDRSDDVDLARWSAGLLDELPEWTRSLDLVESLEAASQIRLGFPSRGGHTRPFVRIQSWLLPRETITAGLARDDDGLIVREPPSIGDPTFAVPATNPRVVLVRTRNQREPIFVRFRAGQPGRIAKPALPLEIETLSGARVRVGAGDNRTIPAQRRRRGYVNAKVVLLGDTGVGKSGLAARLCHDRWEKTESSHGMEIQRLVLPQADDQSDVEREAWLWDLGGQPDYRLTHQLFMEQTSLAVLVFDPADAKVFDTVSYWQGALRNITRSHPVPCILVAARCDRPGLRLTMDEVRAWAETRGLHGPVLTAAKLKQHPGIKELRALITKLLPWETLEFRSTLENFAPLKDAVFAIRDAKDAGVVVTPKELEARVRKAAPRLVFTPEELRAVAGLLAGEGVLYRLPYGDLIVLQPSWVNTYASTLVKLAGDAEDHLGHVPLAIIQPGQLPNDGMPRLSLEDERQLLPALIALFLERGLAWKQETETGSMLVFPNFVRLPRPEPPPRPERTVVYRFTGPLEEIYSTLVVRLHYSGFFANTSLYRQAADFKTATGKLAALTMRQEGDRGELEIYFGANLDTEVQAPFQRFVHEHLKAKATDLERLRSFYCPKCGEEATDRKVIDAALQKGRRTILCAYCDPVDPGIIDLRDVLEQQFADETGETVADRAVRRASEEISAAAKEGVMIGEVMTVVFAADQIYRTIAASDIGIDGEIEFRDARKKATGLTYRVQLKSGDSHLRRLKDGSEKFSLKPRYAEFWANQNIVPVLLIIRTSDGRLRYMNATEAIRSAQRANPGRPVTQLVFTGKDFTREAVLRLRDELLKS